MIIGSSNRATVLIASLEAQTSYDLYCFAVDRGGNVQRDIKMRTFSTLSLKNYLNLFFFQKKN